MTARIFLKLISGVVCLIVIALIAVDLVATRVAESNYIQNLTRELGDKGRMLALSTNMLLAADRSTIQNLSHAAGARLTVIDREGRVLLDSDANPIQMENHRGRPELMDALRGVQGSSIRRSSTIGVNFLYVAVPVPAGALRLAVPLSEINRQVNAIRWKMLASTAVAFLPAVAIAAIFARRISKKFSSVIAYAAELAKGNFRARLSEAERGEFGLLSRKLNETGKNLQKTVEQLHYEHAELEKLERVRKDFVINVSHELRTPLASIQGYTETLMDGALEDSDNNMRFLSIIRHNAERLTRLTADLLTLSRVELGTQDFHFATYPVNALVADALDSMRPIAEKKNIHLLQHFAPDDSEVFCDPEAVSQILTNLLDNAIKYTPGGGAITAGATPTQSQVEIFVRDTGMGIPAEELPRLFERFYRVDKARSRALGGTGLGLAIVKHLVRVHGGKVRVESQPNRGSTFYFTLPTEEKTTASRQDERSPDFSGADGKNRPSASQITG